MKLLVDENLPIRLGRGLGALFEGLHQIEHIRDKYGPGLPDEEWIKRLGGEGGWCVLSGDRRIAKQKPSRELFNRAGLVGFFPLPAVMERPLPLLTARILTVWPVMEQTARTMGRGCFDIGVKAAKFNPIG